MPTFHLPRHQNGSSKSGLAAVSLFSGAMGLDLGLEHAGFSVRVAVEVSKDAIETIKLNRPDLPVIPKPIQQVTTTEILQMAGLRQGEITLISAGPCCQSFSTVGKRQSVSDQRGNLFRDFCRIVRQSRPRFFIMENVKGILSAAVRHRPLNKRGPGFPHLAKEEQFGSALKLILRELAKLQYYVVFGLLNAADYGVPQKRWRVFFLGSRDGEELSFPLPTHGDPNLLVGQDGHVRNDLLAWITMRNALRGVRPKMWYEFDDDRHDLLKRLKPGQNWRDLPVRLQRRALGAALDSWGGRTGFCRRLSWDEPSPTLTTDPVGRATTLCHPKETRPLSVEEYAALQQFPSEWKFVGSLNQQYMQIGNAVPVGLGTAVGLALRRTMRITGQNGLNSKNYRRRGSVECEDPKLRERLESRKKTQLHPRRLRRYRGLAAARKWLQASV